MGKTTRIAITMGDPFGVGPEVALAAAKDPPEGAEITFFGDPARFPGCRVVAVPVESEGAPDPPAPSAAGGRAALAALDLALKAIRAGDSMTMAEESSFFSGRNPDGSPRRNWERIRRNHCAMLSLDANGGECRRALEGYFKGKGENPRFSPAQPSRDQRPPSSYPPSDPSGIEFQRSDLTRKLFDAIDAGDTARADKLAKRRERLTMRLVGEGPGGTVAGLGEGERRNIEIQRNDLTRRFHDALDAGDTANADKLARQRRRLTERLFGASVSLWFAVITEIVAESLPAHIVS